MKLHRSIFIPAALLMATGCTATEQECSGFEVTSLDGDGSFTVPELMAHATSMGMTQQEAETLIYLEGITLTATVEADRPLCIDGRPG